MEVCFSPPFVWRPLSEKRGHSNIIFTVLLWWLLITSISHCSALKHPLSLNHPLPTIFSSPQGSMCISYMLLLPSSLPLSRMAGKILLAVKLQVRGDFRVKSLLVTVFISFSATVMPFIKVLYKSHHTSNHSLVYLSVFCPALEIF